MSVLGTNLTPYISDAIVYLRVHVTLFSPSFMYYNHYKGM